MALSIKTKIWLPAIAVSIGLVFMSVASAVRTVKSQAITVKEQSDQQSKLELSARWRGLAEAQALRTLGAALAADDPNVESLRSGTELTLKQLVAAFEKSNLTEINPQGQKFDPNFHQAISMIEADQEPNTVVNVLQKGYLLAERVLRPALVIVAKPK